MDIKCYKLNKLEDKNFIKNNIQLLKLNNKKWNIYKIFDTLNYIKFDYDFMNKIKFIDNINNNKLIIKLINNITSYNESRKLLFIKHIYKIKYIENSNYILYTTILYYYNLNGKLKDRILLGDYIKSIYEDKIYFNNYKLIKEKEELIKLIQNNTQNKELIKLIKEKNNLNNKIDELINNNNKLIQEKEELLNKIQKIEKTYKITIK